MRILLALLLFLSAAWWSPVQAHGGKEHGVPTLAAPADPAPESPALPAEAAAAAEAAAPAEAAAAAPEAPVENIMIHPGMPEEWVQGAAIVMLLIAVWAVFAKAASESPARSLNLSQLPVVGPVVRFLNRSPYPLLAARLASVSVFLFIIAAGFFGTEHPEHNIATSFVWNIWWPLVIVAVFFIGSAWCAICPWDTLAGWIVRRSWWKRVAPHPGLNLKVPRALQNVWIALLMFMGLSWLELGAGVTGKPVLTASLGVIMLVLSIVFLLFFERKAFCRYACPVGRTVGFYSRLSPIEVRPVNQSTCDSCKTLECFHGSQKIEPCPSKLVVGRFSENSFCLSCGNCVLSCPSQNVSWRLRTMDTEAKKAGTPGWDSAWFMLALLGITIFHGISMIPQWSEWLLAMARLTGETGSLFFSFATGMLASTVVPVGVYALAIWLVSLCVQDGTSYKKLFGGFAFTALPLAFAYHLAHNMDHLLGEGGDVLRVIANPFGWGLAPLTSAQRHDIMMQQVVPETVMFALQAGFIVMGFWLAVQIARYQARKLIAGDGLVDRARKMLPLIGFFAVVTAANVWLLAQDMEMRF
ncbi:4Fe-4S binding protein [Ramlibacter monticola]|uniref:4Fe-4S binding protein n=1 Tax=Ramlibacter monticola TaxID=1926872 RepID=A0A937CS73_9BURK|nr:4Fe-4S binding protein [Ramlibacter monticola]MBL0390811.1 4Fe-4S binding protein [Ramlibacter monticola]